MAEFLNVEPLNAAQIVTGNGDGADLQTLTDEQKAALTANGPLWFYILREAEVNGGKLGELGGRIVVEVFHRAMESSRPSIVREPNWRPTLGPDANTFRMIDLLINAFDGKVEELNPLGELSGSLGRGRWCSAPPSSSTTVRSATPCGQPRHATP